MIKFGSHRYIDLARIVQLKLLLPHGRHFVTWSSDKISAISYFFSYCTWYMASDVSGVSLNIGPLQKSHRSDYSYAQYYLQNVKRHGTDATSITAR